MTKDINDGKVSLQKDDLILQGDFSALKRRLKPNNLNGEMLVKAARLKHFEGTPTLLDATAGMGEDALLLAAAGFYVLLYEYNPQIAQALSDTIRRAADDPDLSEIIQRMEVHNADSIQEMPKLSGKVDVVYLDPMFPKRKKSGRIKKKFQVLQDLELPCADEEGLLEAAFLAHPKKIVIKRPVKAEPLAGRKPDYSLKGSVIRYDCFVPG
ncbi:MAG: class I SAM-dependent methyltransferase [Lachnospiraceae bacterium]|nr:class I SAM-dependent methyltransferase [Lachnospiraceae bacterium]